MDKLFIINTAILYKKQG